MCLRALRVGAVDHANFEMAGSDDLDNPALNLVRCQTGPLAIQIAMIAWAQLGVDRPSWAAF